MKLFSRLTLALAGIVTGITFAYAQSSPQTGNPQTVTVKVSDKTGAMPGASVIVKGTTNGQITGLTCKTLCLGIDFLKSEKEVFKIRYTSQLSSEVLYLGVE